MPSTVSVSNYQIPSGIVYFRADGQSAWRDLGNVPKLTLKAIIETSEHKTSRDGNRSVDDIQEISKDIEATFTAEEVTPENLAMFWLGEQSTDSDGHDVVTMLTSSSLKGDLKFEGAANSKGPVYTYLITGLKLVPTDSQELISDKMTSLSFSGKASGGTITKTSGGA